MSALHVAALTRAEAQLRDGKPTEAMGTIRNILKEQPGHIGARLLLARVHAQENPHIAILILEELLHEQPDNIQVVLLLSELLVQSGRIAQARQHLEHIIRIAPPDTRLAQALARLQPASEIHRLRGPDIFDHPLLAERLESLGRVDAAVALWERIALANPELPPSTAAVLQQRIDSLKSSMLQNIALIEPLPESLPASPQLAYECLSQWARRTGIL